MSLHSHGNRTSNFAIVAFPVTDMTCYADSKELKSNLCLYSKLQRLDYTQAVILAAACPLGLQGCKPPRNSENKRIKYLNKSFCQKTRTFLKRVCVAVTLNPNRPTREEFLNAAGNWAVSAMPRRCVFGQHRQPWWWQDNGSQFAGRAAVATAQIGFKGRTSYVFLPCLTFRTPAF